MHSLDRSISSCFLHGYGANGADLLGLDPLSKHLPDTLFIAPDAPESCAGSPFGFQWFPIPWIDGSSEEKHARYGSFSKRSKCFS